LLAGKILKIARDSQERCTARAEFLYHSGRLAIDLPTLEMSFTSNQKVALAIIPKFSSALSIVADSLVILEISYLQRSKLERVYNRLILSMALYDLSVASAKFLSTWPIPSESSVAFASGNYQTCQAQGFFLQFGIGAVVTNCCLSCYLLLVICFSWKETQMRRKAEPLFHAVSFVIAAGTAIASYFLKL
jgi:hypothetical protein